MVPILARGIFCRGSQELQVSLKNVFDPQKNIAEPGPTHERSQRFPVVRNTRGHGLYEIIELVEASRNDGFAQRLETMHVEHDIVVNQEDGAGSVVARVANVGNHALEGIGVEVAAAHFDDGAETAVIGTSPRSLDDIHLASQQCIAFKHTRITVGQPDFLVIELVNGPGRIVCPAAFVAVGETANPIEAISPLEGTQQLPKSHLPLAAHNVIDVQFLVGFRGQAGIVAANYDLHSRFQGAYQFDNAPRRAPLECHYREANHFRIKFAHKPGDGFANSPLYQNQIGDGHAMMRVDIPRKRGKGAVGHTDGYRGHVLERIRHRKQQDVHETVL